MRYLTTALIIGLISSGWANAEKLVIKGSDTLGAKLVPQIKESFKSSYPEATFEIAAEGSSTGIAAVIDGTADIGMSSRDAKPQEITAALAKGVIMQETIACYDGIAVVVNESNPIDNLTLKQVEEIFTGDANDWSLIGDYRGPISVYTRNTASGTYSSFKELAMDKRDYGPSTQKMAGNEQIASEVGKNPYGIGYIGMAYVGAEGIKVVNVDGIEPCSETIGSGQYPIARPTFYYTNGAPTGLVKRFLDYATGPEVAEIVTKVGFFPVKQK